jgi:hypothetical protein
MRAKRWAAVLAGLTLAANSYAAGFINGGFEAGDFSGWTVGGGARSSQNLSSMNPADYLPGGSRYASPGNAHSAIVTPGLDPTFGALMPNIVYGGSYSARVQDTTTGGYVSVVSQTVNNYTDANIFFAWLAVLENGGHSAEQSAAMIITLKDLTAGDTVISRIYNAVGGGGGVDSRFTQAGSYFYTPLWQVEQLAIGPDRMGHNFELIVLATDCGPTAHEGYIYLDGFGAITPPPGGDVPEPATGLLFGAALLGMAGLRRRRSA